MRSIMRVLISARRTIVVVVVVVVVVVISSLAVNYNDSELMTAPRCARTETYIRARSVQPS
jgi:hypothetical protein